MTELKKEFKIIDSFYLVLDETINIYGRCILNVLIRVCFQIKRNKPKLISTATLDKNNADNVNAKTYLNSISFLTMMSLQFKK